MQKSADAFRTISEVAEWLDTPTHVLRFWESKFSQIKPVKRAGGRRYYRPKDMLLIGGIKRLLHDDGMTIKGAQKLLKEQGIKHVSSLSQPLADDIDLNDVSFQEDPVPTNSQSDTPSVTDAPLSSEDVTPPAIDMPDPVDAPLPPSKPIADVIPLHVDTPTPIKAQPSLFDEDAGQLNFWAEDVNDDSSAETADAKAHAPLPEAQYQSLLDYLTEQPLSALQKENIAPVVIRMRDYLEKNG